MKNNNAFNWLIFIVLSLIWGSSFVLMKEGLKSLTAFQVASLRIISAGVIFLPIVVRSIIKIPAKKIGLIFLSGVLGSLLPAFCFCIAEQHIDSSLAGTLNALTPIFAIIVGALFFKTNTARNKILGIAISFTGSILLFFAQPGFYKSSNATDVLLIIAATICYGININLVGKFLRDIPSLNIVAVALSLNAIPAAFVLYFTGYFEQAIFAKEMLVSTASTTLLGVVGTAAASVIFYMLIKRSGVVFSSMVTYAIPIVAIFWGIVYGETVGWKQFSCLLIILLGVYVANRAGKTMPN
ncbi:MAG: DMT family transporter [Ferruginibacter sp.]